ncbi:MAG: hypothetical protein H0W78_09355 [Planctomycetes bacterium]|nr:hypothetical protein [Planctomycetota bacterium]
MKTLVAVLALTAGITTATSAMEWKDIRVGPQVLLGTSGFEPGAFAEFTWDQFRLRPELFLHDRDRPGAGVAGLWQLPLTLLDGHTLHIGPRLAYHNGDDRDDPRGEISAMGIYNMPIPPKVADSRHHIEIIAATGVVDEDGAEVAFSAGAGYVFRF